MTVDSSLMQDNHMHQIIFTTEMFNPGEIITGGEKVSIM